MLPSYPIFGIVWNVPKLKILAHAFVDWAGEAIVGLVPLIAFYIVNVFSVPVVNIYYCPSASGALDAKTCMLSVEGVSQEACILTVVVSGLALWSIICGNVTTISTSGRISVILCIVSLLAGSLLYALFAEHIAKEAAEQFSYHMLITALASSLSLRIESTILNQPE